MKLKNVVSAMIVLVSLLLLSSVATAARAGEKEDFVVTLDKLSPEQVATLKRSYYSFEGDLELLKAAYCESSFEHTNPDGSVKVGEVDPRDKGLMQINTGYHLADSKRLGFNIFDEEGNRQYARFLKRHQGMRPWKPSLPCRSKLRLPVLRELGLMS